MNESKVELYLLNKRKGGKANNHSHIGHTHKPDDPKIKKDKESQG